MGDFTKGSSFISEDPSGKEVRINVFTRPISIRNSMNQGPDVEIELRTDDGLVVRKLEPGRYVVKSTGVELTTTDSGAP